MFRKDRSEYIIAISIGALVAFAWYWAVGNVGFDLADEGYYWYGAQATRQGQVPIRDFLAYDPARYVFAAAITYVLGATGLREVRITCYIVLFLLIACALVIFLHSTRDVRQRLLPKLSYCFLLAATMALWMYPYYKVFDLAICLFLIGGTYSFLRRPGPQAGFVLGCIVGGAFMVGRNHGVYGILCSAIAAGVLAAAGRHVDKPVRTVATWVCGTFVGYLPMLIGFILIDNFLLAFVDGALVQISSGATNIGLEVPWPWTVDTKVMGYVLSLPSLCLGGCFVVAVLFPFLLIPLAASRGVFDRRRAALLSSLCVCFPYTWYAFSRADLVHVVLPMLPVILFVTIFISRFNVIVATPVMLLVICASLGTLFDTPSVNYLLTRAAYWRPIALGDADIFVHDWQIPRIRQRLALITSGDDRSFLALPDMPSLHAMLNQPMHVHDIYVLSGASAAYEDQEIGRINAAKPSVILLSNLALDRKVGWRFSDLRPRTYAWIQNHYKKTNLGGSEALEFYELTRQ